VCGTVELDTRFYGQYRLNQAFSNVVSLIVEDNQNGIKAAQASGANVMIVNSVEGVNYTNIKVNIKKFESVEV
jgi:beta-phosphoglucomutase-like phosphatase (HAD superfamily)